MNTEEAIKAIEEALAKIQRLRNYHPYSPEHVEFLQTTGMELARIFGSDSVIVGNFSHVQYHFTGTFLAGYSNFEQEKARHNYDAYVSGLRHAEGILKSAKAQLTKHGLEALQSESRVTSPSRRVFVSHGTESHALSKTERYLRALGVEPVIVIRKPSEGMSVDDLVDARMKESDCALILATADEEVSGRKQPRPNVIHEIGLAQEKFANKVIYLKEEGCEFPSNVKPKVWETFTQDNMERAFQEIVLELRAFGIV